MNHNLKDDEELAGKERAEDLPGRGGSVRKGPVAGRGGESRTQDEGGGVTSRSGAKPCQAPDRQGSLGFVLGLQDGGQAGGRVWCFRK